MDWPKRSAVAGLPDDLLVEILSRVPVKDLHRSKCVARGWYHLITDPHHREKFPQTLLGFFYGEGRLPRDDYPDEDDSDEDEYDEYDGKWPRQCQEFGGFVELSRYTLPAAVDHSFFFLEELHGIDNLRLLRSCNGLLLFEHGFNSDTLGYIECNPATEQWMAVPSHWTPAYPHDYIRHAYLVFDPAVSSHFHIVMFWEEDKEGGMVTVHAYSSKAGVWTHSETDWTKEEKQRKLEEWRCQIRYKSRLQEPSAFVNGTLFLLMGGYQILEVDVEGKTRRIIPALFRMSGGGACCHVVLIGQSQGQLYCISDDAHGGSHGVSIWVIEDFDTQELVLKHSVSWLQLFGQKSFLGYEVVAIHPDCNMFFYCALLEPATDII
uniref:F-box domain-containing protein n=1 Tax=Arundo donax TaxID=35708 RepID=A0A0A8YJ47_ARUDO